MTNTTNSSKRFTWTIALFSLFLAALGFAFSQAGATEGSTTFQQNDKALEMVSGTFQEQERHFQKNDEKPVLQWIEQTRRNANLEAHCVVLLKEKGSNAEKIIPEMAAFLQSSGYQVSTDSSNDQLPKELLGLRFEIKQRCVLIHIGTL